MIGLRAARAWYVIGPHVFRLVISKMWYCLFSTSTVCQQRDGVVGTFLCEVEIVGSELWLVDGPVMQLLVEQERLEDGIARRLTDVRRTRQSAVCTDTDLGVRQ